MTYGLYDVDSRIRTTTVVGNVPTGLHAADGSINIVLDDASHTGLYHPCGALRVNSSTSRTAKYDASGAFYLGILLGGSPQPSGPPTGDGTMDFSIVTGDDTGLLALLEDI